MNLHKRFAVALLALGLVAPAFSSAADFGSIEDRVKIEHTWNLYALYLDTANGEGVASTFTEDAVFDVAGKVFKGHKEIAGFVTGMRQVLKLDARPAVDKLGRRFAPIRHILSNLVVEMNGNTATADSNWVEIVSNGRLPSGRGKPPSIINAGRYRDVFVKEKGQWLIKERKVIADVFEQLPKEFLDGASTRGPTFPDNDGPTAQSP